MNSSVIGLELRDDKNEEIPVENTKEPIEIWVPSSGMYGIPVVE